jgi:hypothetical protein
MAIMRDVTGLDLRTKYVGVYQRPRGTVWLKPMDVLEVPHSDHRGLPAVPLATDDNLRAIVKPRRTLSIQIRLSDWSVITRRVSQHEPNGRKQQPADPSCQGGRLTSVLHGISFAYTIRPLRTA